MKTRELPPVLFALVMIISLMLNLFGSAYAEQDMPHLGERTVAQISWSRTTEPAGFIVLPIANWNWSDVENINTDKTEDIWDGGTIGDKYIKSSRRNWDIATWHTERHYWNGSGDVRRFRGEFRVPDGYSARDDVMLSSVGDYSSLGLDDIIAINDNIYIFIYPKSQQIDDSNFLEYFAFWTGTACQDAAKQINNGNPITFHGIEGTTPHDYKLELNLGDGEQIPPENLLSHTDGWYCEAFQNNVSYIMHKHADESEFVIDLFIEDFAEDGGMDRLELTFTKTTEDTDVLPPTEEPEVLPPTEGPEVPPTEEPEVLPPTEEPEVPPTEEPEVLPPTEAPEVLPTEEPEVLPPTEVPEVLPTEKPEVLPPMENEQGAEEVPEESPQTGDTSVFLHSFALSAISISVLYLLKAKRN